MNHTRRHISAIVTFVMALILTTMTGSALAGSSTNLPNGVHIDPNSPVAKEYALPLSTARGAPPGSSSSGQTFGAGITPASQTSAPPSTPRSAARGNALPSAGVHHSSRAATRTRRPPERHATASASPGARRAALPSIEHVLRSGSSSGFAWMIGIAAAILGFVVVGRFLVTRPRRNHPTTS